jgi:hypothetical protein
MLLEHSDTANDAMPRGSNSDWALIVYVGGVWVPLPPVTAIPEESGQSQRRPSSGCKIKDSSAPTNLQKWFPPHSR